MKQQLLVLILFAGLSIGLRLFSFFPSVVNHDESTYLVIADAMLQGHLYFVDYVDTKPVGVFLLMAGFQVLFGKSIFMIRLIAALWLALTAFVLYRIQRLWGQPVRVGVATGVIYLLLNSIFTFFGVSPNTETYFNLFTALCLWLILRRRGGWEYFLAGLCLGLGFMIKYVVLFDALAFGFLLLLEQLRKKGSWVIFSGRALLLTVGALLPFGLMVNYYYQQGHLDDFIFYTFTVSGRYPSTRNFTEYLAFLLDFFPRFLPVTIFFLLGLFSKRTPTDLQQFGLIWSLSVLFCILLPGTFFGHYYIQFMLPFSLIAGLVFGWPRVQLPRWLRWAFVPKVGYSLLGLVFVGNLFLQKQDYLDKPDYPRLVARYLQDRLQPDDQIYTGNDAQIIYYLLDRTSPIKYIHPSLFWEEKHLRALELDIPAELAKIKQANPRFILLRRQLNDDRLEPLLREKYHLDKVFEEKQIKIFERNEQ